LAKNLFPREENLELRAFWSEITGLPIKVHPTIKEMFPKVDNPYYLRRNISKITGEPGIRLKNPETTWSAAADESVSPGMMQEEWNKMKGDSQARSAVQKIISYS